MYVEKVLELAECVPQFDGRVPDEQVSLLQSGSFTHQAMQPLDRWAKGAGARLRVPPHPLLKPTRCG